MNRRQLIDRKHDVQARIRTLRPRVERAQREATSRRERTRADRLMRELERLMGEETRLRQAIDRTD